MAETDIAKKTELIAIRLPDSGYFGDRTIDDGSTTSNMKTKKERHVTTNGTVIEVELKYMVNPLTSQPTKKVTGTQIKSDKTYTSKSYSSKGITANSRLVSTWFSDPSAQKGDWSFVPTSDGRIKVKGDLNNGKSTYVMVYYRKV